jgi:putative DNA primase/helicase
MTDRDADSAGELDDVPDAYYEDDEQVKLTAFSQDALAVDFVERNKHRLKWSHGMDWFRDVGSRWAQDDTLRRYDYARQVAREAAAAIKDQKLARSVASSGTVNSILSLARADAEIALPLSAWDSDPMALNTPGGVVDLRNGMMRPRAGDFLTQCTEITPDPSMPMPATARFLSQIFDDDED